MTTKIAPPLEGQRFGRYVVVEALPRAGNNRTLICRCECGTTRSIFHANLVSGRTKSCGCWRSEKSSTSKATHGESGNSHHKTAPTIEYRAWKNMKNRCFNTRTNDYAHYGARGITVCARWSSSFEAFLHDMGRRPSGDHSIERNDNDGNYEPGNCRWATRVEQQSNTRRNHLVVLHGERLTITAAARKLGVHRVTAAKALSA